MRNTTLSVCLLKYLGNGSCFTSNLKNGFEISLTLFFRAFHLNTCEPELKLLSVKSWLTHFYTLTIFYHNNLCYHEDISSDLCLHDLLVINFSLFILKEYTWDNRIQFFGLLDLMKLLRTGRRRASATSAATLEAHSYIF